MPRVLHHCFSVLTLVSLLRLASLAQQMNQLTTALAQINRQLSTIQGELEELKGHRNLLPLILASSRWPWP